MDQHSFNPEESLGYQLKRASRTMGQRLRQHFTAHDLDMPIEHWEILATLYGHDGLYQRELVCRIFKDKGTITRAVNLLERMNIVVRIQDEQDKRNKRVYLTHKGKAMRDQLGPLARQTIEDATAGIPEKDIKTCMEVLKKIYHNFSK
ncbi:MAG: MarR family winged helix-turn-helix transcriptional regulator [Bacteroidota bacterium]